MKQYEITNRTTGELIGRFMGVRANEALSSLARACGYASYDRLMAENPKEFSDLRTIEII
jgi:hypothetical protein